MRKLISINIPCFNEIDNVEPLFCEIEAIFSNSLNEYDYLIQFVDNCSDDGTRDKLRDICMNNKNVRAILNGGNYKHTSSWNGLFELPGDCVITMAADFQDPPDLILSFVRAWEKGARIVCGVKTTSEESRIVYYARSFYYKLLKWGSGLEIIDHFTGFGLYDRSFIEDLRKLNEPTPFMRTLVAELGYGIECVEFNQPKRKSGISKNKFGALYDIAVRSFTDYTGVVFKIAVFIGGLGFLVGLIACAISLIGIFSGSWTEDGIDILILTSVCMFGFLNFLCFGVLGEYLATIIRRQKKRPYAIVEERIGSNW